jgi:hypothetical protein
VLALTVYLRSCRKVADTFDLIRRRGMLVKKTWVGDRLKTHAEQLRRRRRAIKGKPIVLSMYGPNGAQTSRSAS